jgi:hypothetical protein
VGELADARMGRLLGIGPEPADIVLLLIDSGTEAGFE